MNDWLTELQISGICQPPEKRNTSPPADAGSFIIFFIGIKMQDAGLRATGRKWIGKNRFILLFPFYGAGDEKYNQSLD